MEPTGGGCDLATSFGYKIALRWFLNKGHTPGKLLMGEQVVEHLGEGTPD